MEQQPVIITSLSPRLNRGLPATAESGQLYQRRCVQSWLDVGARVISLNNALEIAILEDVYHGVEFVLCNDIATHSNPKRLPAISEMLSVGKTLPHGSVFAIANSDVEFRGDETVLNEIFEAARGGVVYSNRFEQNVRQAEPGLPYLYGYDFFIADNSFIIPEEIKGFQIGSPWWDYLLLYLLAARDVPLSMITSPLIAHQLHDQAWDTESWRTSLGYVAKRIRGLAAEEGPAAALLGYICQSMEPGIKPSFVMEHIMQPLGTVLGTAMVGYINERCSRVIWFDLVNEGAGHVPRGRAHVSRHVPAVSTTFAIE